ncbi:MAG: hypothetical protein GVY36_14820 [Verrucomicrobia bacterium]|nr:hypothetical protein [Verrucomicrobiota bacterium]
MGGKDDIVTAEYYFRDSLEGSPVAQFLMIAQEPFFHLEQGKNLAPEDFIEEPLRSRMNQFFHD